MDALLIFVGVSVCGQCSERHQSKSDAGHYFSELKKPTMLLCIILSFLGLTLAYVYWHTKNRKLLAISRELPGPPTVPLLGNAWKFITGDAISVFYQLKNEYGDLMRFWLGNDLNIIASDPKDLRVLLTSRKTSVKGKQYKYMRDVLGEGILSGSGAIWRRHRKIVTPNFGKRAVESFTDLFNVEGDVLLKNLEPNSGTEVDIYKYIVQITTYTVCQCLMGLSREQTLSLPKLQTLIDTAPDMYDIVFERMTKWWQQIYPLFWVTESHRRQKHFLATMYECCGAIVKHREEALKNINMKIDKALLFNSVDSKNNAQTNVIDRLILSEELNSNELVQETFTLFTASQEATAKMTSFLLLMMAYHPECQERLYQEILYVVGAEESTVTDEQLHHMPYLKMVFKEIIRMYPTGAALQRSVAKDIAISNTTIPAGCSLVIPIYHIQRDPRFWKNPDAFDPDRFTPENSKGRPANAFIPFGLGPMDCLGRHFGTKLVKTLAIKVLQKFKLASNETYKDMKLIIAISVKSVNGFKVILSPRNTKECKN